MGVLLGCDPDIVTIYYGVCSSYAKTPRNAMQPRTNENRSTKPVCNARRRPLNQPALRCSFLMYSDSQTPPHSSVRPTQTPQHPWFALSLTLLCGHSFAELELAPRYPSVGQAVLNLPRRGEEACWRRGRWGTQSCRGQGHRKRAWCRRRK